MGTIVKPNTFTSGTSAVASEVNANFDTIYTEFNGNIEAANLASGAVTNAKIGALAVSSGKLASGAVTAAKLDSGVQADIDARLPKDGSEAMTGDLDITGGAPAVFLMENDTTDDNYEVRAGASNFTIRQVSDAKALVKTVLQYNESEDAIKARVATVLSPVVTEASLVSNTGPMYVFKINCDATTPTLVNGPSGWTITRNSEGDYTIDCGTDLAHTNYIVQLTPRDGVQAGFWIVDIKNGEFDVDVLDMTTARTDAIDFSCTVIDYS